MARATRVRRLLAALLTVVQATSLSLAASAAALATECPVHVAFASAQAHDPSAHRMHDGSGHSDHGALAPAGPEADPDQSHPQFAGYACCLGHVAGAVAAISLPRDHKWAGHPAMSPADAVVPGELSSVDPPPRSVL
jgi:hypothetical protein